MTLPNGPHQPEDGTCQTCRHHYRCRNGSLPCDDCLALRFMRCRLGASRRSLAASEERHPARPCKRDLAASCDRWYQDRWKQGCAVIPSWFAVPPLSAPYPAACRSSRTRWSCRRRLARHQQLTWSGWGSALATGQAAWIRLGSHSMYHRRTLGAPYKGSPDENSQQ
jgi:hypothetical protein